MSTGYYIHELLRAQIKNLASHRRRRSLRLAGNPDISTALKTAAVTAGVVIIVGTIVEDIITAGAGIADDWASFMVAYRLVRIAAL